MAHGASVSWPSVRQINPNPSRNVTPMIGSPGCSGHILCISGQKSMDTSLVEPGKGNPYL